MAATIKTAISLFKQPKTKPDANSIHFLDEDLASVPTSSIPEEFRELSRFMPVIVLVPKSAVHDKTTQKKPGPNPTFEVAGKRKIPDDTPDPEEIYFRNEQRRIVNAAVSELRPRVRKVVELRELQGHSVGKTAQILGISSSAVKTRMFHARAALRRIPALKRIGRSNRAA